MAIIHYKAAGVFIDLHKIARNDCDAIISETLTTATEEVFMMYCVLTLRIMLQDTNALHFCGG